MGTLALSGQTFDSISPATGEVLAQVAEGGKEDVDRAVAAARRAFDGEWSRFKPFDRQQVMLTLAELVDKHYDELSALDTLDMGGPPPHRSAGAAPWACCATTPAWPPIQGDTIENSLPGEIFSYTLKEPVGVVGAIIPWNGPLGGASGRSARCWPRAARWC